MGMTFVRKQIVRKACGVWTLDFAKNPNFAFVAAKSTSKTCSTTICTKT